MENRDMRTRRNSSARASPLRKTVKAIAGVLLAVGLLFSAASALAKTTVIFNYGTTDAEIDDFIAAWETIGVSTLMRPACQWSGVEPSRWRHKRGFGY